MLFKILQERYSCPDQNVAYGRRQSIVGVDPVVESTIVSGQIVG